MKEIIEKVGTRKLIITSCIIIGVIFVLVAGALIYHEYFYKKSFSEIEKIMVSSAKEYYSNHPKKLPTTSGETVEISASKLVSLEYMETFNEYLKDDNILCKGTINVTKNGESYRYVPILDCGKDYKVEFFAEHIKNNVNVVSSGTGLYENGDELVYRGESVKNHVEFDGNKWLIVKIENNRTLLIFDDWIKDFRAVVWDDRYNKDKSQSYGINDYKVSRVNDTLKSLFKGDKLFSSDGKLLLKPFDLFIGKRAENDEDKNGTSEKAIALKNQYIGLLPAYNFLYASLDKDCVRVTDDSCSNYNYLNLYEKNWWTVTGNSSLSYRVYKINSAETAVSTNASTMAYVRPIVLITDDAVYVSGDGSRKNPYKFK